MFLIEPPADCHTSAVGSLMFTADGRFLAWDRVRRANSAGLIVASEVLNLGAGPQVWVEAELMMRIESVGLWGTGDILIVSWSHEATTCHFASPHRAAKRIPLPHQQTHPSRPSNLPIQVADGRVWWLDDGRFRGVRAETGEAVACSARGIRVLRFSVAPANDRIAAVHYPNDHAEVAVWRPSHRDPVVRRRAFPGFTLLPDSVVSKLEWSADGRYLAVLIPHRLYVLDLETQEVVGPLRCPHTRLFVAPAFDPTGRRLYAGGANVDGGVYAWEVGTWAPVAAYSWPVGPVRSIAISPDGTVAAVGGDRGAVAVWDVDG